MEKPIFDQSVLFISDAHLGGFSEEDNTRIQKELIQLVNYCQQNRIQIAVLGDLFDYWMEYPNQAPILGGKLLNCFENFNRHLGPSLYITGNHDNWTRNHLQQQGFYLEHEHFMTTLGSHRTMLLHGDGLSNPEQRLPRPLSHRLLRNKFFIKFYQTLLPPKWGITAMKYFSRFNRLLHMGDDPSTLDQWARRKLKETDVDWIISGHDHIPRRKQFSFGTYINLGTFYHHRTMALYNNDTIRLVLWEHTSQTIQPFKKKTDNFSIQNHT